jgi:hypothetical protein
MLCLCTIIVDDQQEIGTATGIAGSMRATISTIITTVYSAVLSNRLTSTIPTRVPAAMVTAGLPVSSVADCFLLYWEVHLCAWRHSGHYSGWGSSVQDSKR